MSVWDAFKKGPGWDLADAYDWFPGVESGEEAERMRKLRAVQGAAPAPPGLGGYQDLIGQLRALSGRPLGAGYETSPLYKSLQSDITEQMRRRGWQAGGQLAAQGLRPIGEAGAGRRMATEQTEMEGRLRTQASAQAQAAQVQQQLGQFDMLLKQAGFTAGINERDWEQKFRLWAAQVGFAADEIERAVEQQRTLLGLLGGAAQAYFTYKGAEAGAAALRPGGGAGTAGA